MLAQKLLAQPWIDAFAQSTISYRLIEDLPASKAFILFAFDLHGALYEWFPLYLGDLSGLDANERNPLHYGAANGTVDSFRLILDTHSGGRDFCSLLIQKDVKGKSPLAYAIQYGHLQLCEILLRTVERWHFAIDGKQSMRKLATDSRSQEIFQLLLRSDYIPLYTETEVEAAMLSAIDLNSPTIFKHILNKNSSRKLALSLLPHAIKRQNLQIMQLILSSNSDINALYEGERPIHVAAQSSQEDFIHLLLSKGVSVNSKNSLGQTPLHVVCSYGFIVPVKILLQERAAPDPWDERDRSAAHYAAIVGHDQILRLLLEAKANIRRRDQTRQTPLHLAAAHGHEAATELLLEADADPNASDFEWKTPLHQVVNSESVKSLGCLLQHGANIER